MIFFDDPLIKKSLHLEQIMTQTKTILAVETSTAACSVALLYKDNSYQRYEVLPQKHAHRLLEMVDEVLSEANVEGADIDFIAYGEGPGAFTGVRIAAGVVQGLALGWDKPVLGVSSLESMAELALQELQQTQGKQKGLEEIPWCALMDARMKEIYVQSGTFNIQTGQWMTLETQLLAPEKTEEVIKNLSVECIGLGDIKKEYQAITSLFTQWFDVLPSALSVAYIARRIDKEKNSAHKGIALPVYLRNHVADTIEERKQKQL